MRLSEICDYLNIDINEDMEIKNLATLKEAKEDSLSFFHDRRYINDLRETKAGAVILEERFISELPSDTVAIISKNPYEDMAKTTHLFKYKPSAKSYKVEIKEGVEVADNARFGKGVTIGKTPLLWLG